MSNKTMGFMVAEAPDKKRGDLIDQLTSAFGEASESLGDNAYTKYFGVKWRRKAPFNIIDYIKSGIPVSEAETLAQHLGLGAKEFALDILGMSDSTYRRRMKDATPRLTTDESDKAVRYAHLLGLATGLMEGEEKAAREWLTSPARALGEQTPYEMALTEAGARRVEDLIISLEYGMFN